MYLYKKLDMKKEIKFTPLIDIAKLRTNKKINADEVKAMELALITLFKPRYNVAGVETDFLF